MSREEFSAESARVVDLMEDGTHLPGALKVLYGEYPEFAPLDSGGEENPDCEDFSDWLPSEGETRNPNAFILALIGPDDVPVGLSAFMISPESKTASLTYVAGVDPAAKQRLMEETNRVLGEREVKAVFVEFQSPSPNPERDAADALSYSGGGLEHVNIPYQQPISADDPADRVIPGMGLWVKFVDPNLTPEDKNDLVRGYIEALIRNYDPEMKMEHNKEMYAECCQALEALTWGPAAAQPTGPGLGQS